MADCRPHGSPDSRSAFGAERQAIRAKKVPGRLWAPVGLRESCGAWDLLWLARSRGAGQGRKGALERKWGMLGNGGMPTIYTVAYWNHSHILWADVISR